MNIFKNKSLKIILIIFSVLVAGVVWYSPFLFKGHSPDAVNDQLVLARNMAKTGKYSLYNDHGVLLASSEVALSGEMSTIGNRFTAGLYSKILGYMGQLDINDFMVVSVIINSLTLLVLVFLVYYLFGTKIALIFSFIYTLLPANWRNVYALGNYEFALFFLSLFFLFFILGKDKRYGYVHFIFSGLFLSFAVLAKEAFLITLPVIFIYLAFKKKYKMLIFTFSPVVVVMSIFYLPNFFRGDNIYKGLILKEHPEQKEEKFDFSLAGHLYPDYYTFRFDRENFLEQYKNVKKGDEGFIKSLMVKKAADNVGADSLDLSERFVVSSYLFVVHVARFFSLEDIGGVFIFLLGLLGFIYLKRRDLFLRNFLAWWMGGSIILFSYAALAGRNHLMDFGFAIGLFVSMGIVYLLEIFSQHFNWGEKNKLWMSIFAVLIFGYGLLTIDHVVWGRAYDSDILRIHTYAGITKQKNIKEGEVIATSIRSDESITFNLLTDKSLIIFRPETMEKIISQGKTKEVFDYFGIKHILGYSDDLSEKIAKNSGASIIATSNIKIIRQETSSGKSFLMNLMR